MIKEACAKYFHFIRHPLETGKKRSDKILTALVILSCISLAAPAAVGILYGVSSLGRRIKNRHQLSQTDVKVRTASSQKNSARVTANARASEAAALGRVGSDDVPLDAYGSKLLALCEKIRETKDLDQKAEAIAQWNKVFLAEIVVTTPGLRIRLAKEGLQFTEQSVITFSESVQSQKSQGKKFKVWMADSTKGVAQNLEDYNQWVEKNLSEDERDDYAWGTAWR